MRESHEELHQRSIKLGKASIRSFHIQIYQVYHTNLGKNVCFVNVMIEIDLLSIKAAINFVQIFMCKKIFKKMSFPLNGYEKTLLFTIQTIQGGVETL